MDTTRLRIASDADIVGTVPYLVGYHPRQAVTLLTIGRGERQPSGPLVTVGIADATVAEVVDELAGTVASVHALGFGVYGMVLYLDGPLSESFHRRSTRELVRAVREADDPRVGAWVVADDGWHRLPGFDPFDETARVRDLADLTTGQAVASLVLSGAAPMPDRESLGIVREPDGEDGRALAALVAEAYELDDPSGWLLDVAGDPDERHDHMVRVFSAYAKVAAATAGAALATGGAGAARVEPAGDVEWDALATLVVGLQNRHVRDHLLVLAIDPEHDPGACWDPSAAIGAGEGPEDAERRRPIELAARFAPPGMAAPALSVLAVLAWRRGEGARARVLSEQALDDSPEYALADLVTELLDSGCPPPLNRAFAGEW
ncbi:hypothetical protein CZ771_13165 [Actinomycetales bacterium JB111]|nr:hypothetical protein CZ771_13165 [Actinomycetales bacterium JB111]